jgi:hypothetical protein
MFPQSVHRGKEFFILHQDSPQPSGRGAEHGTGFANPSFLKKERIHN